MSYGIHKVRIINPATGQQRREFASFAALAYVREVNKAGAVRLALKPGHPVMSIIQPDDLIVVMRREPNAPWRIEQVGIARDPEWTRNDAGQVAYTLECPGILHLLSERYIAYYANTTNRTRFTSLAGETIMKRLVDYNAGPGATLANGRRVAGVLAGLALETDGARGNVIPSWTCSWKQLLENLQELATIAGGDFDLEYAPGPVYTFRFYPGQRGTNRASTLVFSAERRNLANERLRIQRSTMATVAIVAGQGVEDKRKIVIRTGNGYSTAAHREIFVDADQAKAADLPTVGDQALADAMAVTDYEFDIRQANNCRYGVHYDLGDIATFVRPDGQTVQHKLQRVTITVQEQREAIVVEVL